MHTHTCMHTYRTAGMSAMGSNDWNRGKIALTARGPGSGGKGGGGKADLRGLTEVTL